MSESSSSTGIPAQLAAFATAVANKLKDTGERAYSYHTVGTGANGTPDVDPVAGSAFTDCSGWMAFALDSVAPVHQAVAAAHRTEKKFNAGDVKTADGGSVHLAEATEWGWARAEVLTDLFKNADGTNGYTKVASFADLRAGDLVAYALGIYADPAGDITKNPGLVTSNDTGHIMVATDAPSRVTDPALLAKHANLSADVVAVYALPVVDSSDLHHFGSPQEDNRNYVVPTDDPRTAANGYTGNPDKGGGVGSGTIWFGVNAAGQPIQFCFGASDSWQPPNSSEAVSIATARLTDTIDLGTTDLQANGTLLVRVYPKATPVLNGVDYTVSEHLVGAGGLEVAGGGTLALSAGNSFKGPILVDGSTVLSVGTSDALGVLGNQVTLGNGATLRTTAAFTLDHALAVPTGNAVLDLAGNSVHITGFLTMPQGAALEVASSKPGGELLLNNNMASTSTILVDAGAALTLTSTGGVPGTINLANGAGLNVGASASLSHLQVSGTATLSVTSGTTLNVSAVTAAAGGVGVVQVSGDGTLSIASGAKLSAGNTLYTGTLAQLNGQTLAGFKPGDVIDVSGLVATTGQAGVTDGVTARYDDATGLLTVGKDGATATVRLTKGLKLSTDGKNTPEAFTVRTDGSGGTLVQLVPATGTGASDALGATTLRAAGGPDGTGVTVGVISVSGNALGGAKQDILNGTLPQNTTVTADPAGTSTDEGREMAQMVHAIAPGANIQLHYAGDGSDDGIAKAITDLVNSGAKVIVDDMSVFGDRLYQAGGPIADAISYAMQHNVTVVTSAGNSGTNYYEASVSLAKTTLPGLPGAVWAYDFGRGTGQFFEKMTFTKNGSGNVDISLGWTQPGQNPAYQLRMAVFTQNADGTYTKTADLPAAQLAGNGATSNIAIAGSQGGGTFYVAVYATAPVSVADQSFKLVVHHEGDTKVFSDPNANKGTGMVSGHALDANEITVGAVPYQNASAATPANEVFSVPGANSGSPFILIDAAGTGTVTAPSKPDVSGVDGISNDVSGASEPFYGTSAAAPTVAGVVALMLQVNSKLTPAQVKDMLKTSALPTSTPLQGGAGLVRAAQAVALASLANGGSATVDYTGKTLAVAVGGTLTTGTGGNTVNVVDRGTVLSHGPDLVKGGTGATAVSTLGSGGTVVGGAGALTVTGGAGNNTVFAGAGGLSYQGGSGFDTVVGLGKSMTATGGTGGGVFFGGGGSTVTAGAGGDTNVVVGGNGDKLYAAGPKGVLFGTTGGDVLMSSAADTGSSVFFGANGTGHMTFITGAGEDLLALGQGQNDVTLGSGHAVIFGNGGHSSTTAITAGSGSLDLAFSGASTVLTIAAGMARSFNLFAYGQGQDSIHLQGFGADEAVKALATQQNVGGGTQLTLSDGSKVSLIGIGQATASLFS